MLYICVQKGDGNLKKKIQTALRPGRAAFYVLFLLFAAGGLYFSKPYPAMEHIKMDTKV